MKKRAQKEWIDLSIQIKEVDQRYAQIKNSELYKKRVELQTRFDLLSTHSIERQLLQSKSLFYVHGDKCGKMLANQLKGFKAKQHITKIQMDDVDLTSDPSKINDTFRSFYSRLYTSDPPNDSTLMENFLDHLEDPTLTHDNRSTLRSFSKHFLHYFPLIYVQCYQILSSKANSQQHCLRHASVLS